MQNNGHKARENGVNRRDKHIANIKRGHDEEINEKKRRDSLSRDLKRKA